MLTQTQEMGHLDNIIFLFQNDEISCLIYGNEKKIDSTYELS